MTGQQQRSSTAPAAVCASWVAAVTLAVVLALLDLISTSTAWAIGAGATGLLFIIAIFVGPRRTP